MAPPINPFFFESPADRWAFTDREELLPALQQALAEQGRRLLLYGRRRMGKTSLIQNAARKAKAELIYVDLSTASDLTEVANKLLHAVPAPEAGLAEKALRLVRKYFHKVALEGGKWKLSADLRPEAAEANLESVLNYIDETAGLLDRPITVCFDEFQEIRTLGGDRAEWKLRGVIQPHRKVNYFFSGSDHRLLAWMTEPQSAFYKQVQTLEVGAIEPGKLAGWINERSRRGGLADANFGPEVVALAGPCTGDVVRLAKTVFELQATGKKRTVRAAFDEIALKELHNEFVGLWRPCTGVQRAVLRALAAGRPPQAADTLQEFGIRSASSAQTAIASLIDSQLLTRVHSTLVFDNPFFHRWVAANSVPETPPKQSPASP